MCSLLFYLLEDFVLNGYYFFQKLFVRFYQGRHLKREFYFFSGIMVILVIYLFLGETAYFLVNLSNILP